MDVGVAALEGAVTSGASVTRRLLVNAGAEVIMAGVDGSVSEGFDVIGTEGSKKKEVNL